MSHTKKIFQTAAAVFCMISMLFISASSTAAYASSGYEFVVLNKYSNTMQIGDEFYLLAVTSNGAKPSFKSSSSSVASVNTYGKVTAKKAGTATITAKIKNGEASCKITVKKTVITLGNKNISLENGETFQLKASASTGHPVTYKSNKSSVAAVDEHGVITAKKPGSATITATADKSSAACKVTVKKPGIKLSRSSVSLFRKETVKLSVTSTSKSTPKWKTSKKSVATVDEYGKVTAVKHGTATITVTVDGVSKTCEVTVKQPEVYFETDIITLSAGEKYQTNVTVSSKNKPEYSCSNSNIASIDKNGKIHAKAAGKAYIYAKEDGVKARMRLIVKAD